MTADRIEKLRAGRRRALELLAHPDPAVREPAKRAYDCADVALGLLGYRWRDPPILEFLDVMARKEKPRR